MAEVLEASGKTVEAAIASAASTLGVTEDQLDYKVIQQPSNGFFGLFGAKLARIEAVVKAKPEVIREKQTVVVDSAEEPTPAVAVVSVDEQAKIAEKFLRDVFKTMNLEVQIERGESEEGVLFQLIGENLGILIGKHGQTLDSLQYLANLAANRGLSENRARIIIDIENYRSRREETLVRLAGHLAEKACRIGEEVHLEPMNRHERKIIHMALQDNRRVNT